MIRTLQSHVTGKPLALAVGLILSQAALAQEKLMLEEVMVTAQKREQNLQDVPVAVTAISSKAIEQLGILTTTDLVRITPSMTYEQSNNKTNSGFRIRGVGTDVHGIGVEQAVAMIVDDVALLAQGQAIGNLLDIERIEVLRGPQSTLFGKAASAGVINIITKSPSDEFEGTVEGTWTDESETRLLGAISGPMSDSLGYRLSGFWYDHDGWGENLTDGQPSKHSFEDGYGFRGKLQWDLSDTVTAMLGAHYSEENADCCARIFREYDNENGRILGLFPEPIADGIKPDDENATIRRDTPSNSETESNGVNLRLSFDIGEFNLLSISAYDKWEYSNDEDVDLSDTDVQSILTGGAVSGGWYSNSSRDLEFMSQEFRLVSPSYDSYDYLIGFYYSDSQTDRVFFRDMPIAPSDWAGSSGTKNTALFGQLNWHFTDKTTVSLGLRAFEEKIDADVQDFLSGGTKTSGKDSDSDVVGKLSLQHAFTDDVMAFVSYTEGYKGQAFDVKGDFSEYNAENPVAPEYSDAYELGLKSTLWDDRMQLNATAFYTVYDNFQVQSTGYDEDGIAFFTLNNVGEMKTQGLELETVTLLSEAFTLVLNAAYIDAEVNDYIGADCFEGQTPEQGCDPVSDTQDIDGGTLPNTPEWKYSIVLDYDQTIESLPFDVFANASYTWQDEVRYGIDQNPLTTQDSYGITNLRAGIRDSAGRYELTAFVNNLFDESYVGGMGDARFLYGGTSDPALLHTIPRNSQQYWGLKAKYSF
jgi:iron complex outermembrane receptor protein